MSHSPTEESPCEGHTETRAPGRKMEGPQEEHNKNRAPGQLRGHCFHSPVLLERTLPSLRRLTPQTRHVQGPTGKGQSLLRPLLSGPRKHSVHLRSNSMSKTTVTPGPGPACEKLNLVLPCRHSNEETPPAETTDKVIILEDD